MFSTATTSAARVLASSGRKFVAQKYDTSRFLSSIRQSQNQLKQRTTTINGWSRRFFSEQAKKAESKSASSSSSSGAGGGGAGGGSWWSSPQFWGAAGAIAGWGMSGAAIYDATQQGPEVISLTMTPVLIVYSTLFARWAWVVQPRNLLLMWCHITNVAAQGNQLRRALEYKMENGQEQEVKEMVEKVGMLGAGAGAAVLSGPYLRQALSNANLGIVSTVAAAPAGPFTVHFWAPMSKWFISGASFLDLHRPTDKISLPQYSALTLTGFFFTRYALLVTPVNYTLCSVNIALFLSSAWHLGRKLKADYIDGGSDEKTPPTTPSE
mmetsp:Transcript_51689/g.124770  ORF Transcript_51689/g.124770 Transcript_51689/m.124770 type:complete len:324 (+) Transcript_51689:145-1116(+)|eukprot:CAMPEP_0113453654 /NCGR_PEP_ID=MMETSP0014_2-20120614/7465_1 /TAXON_ID=2857 /ORGANISM="Nitzschia sp." /LENGTH=323 /DNA_ID=CAMNT_0000345047 /DNA_START=140 /DNA_END=1111 /DNA_ORIENTATION=- /assembly_acc=CAM_ASM_000159